MSLMKSNTWDLGIINNVNNSVLSLRSSVWCWPTSCPFWQTPWNFNVRFKQLIAGREPDQFNHNKFKSSHVHVVFFPQTMCYKNCIQWNLNEKTTQPAGECFVESVWIIDSLFLFVWVCKVRRYRLHWCTSQE